MRISDAKPGETVKVAEGPAKGNEVRVIANAGTSKVGVHANGESWAVRSDLEVE